MITYEKLYDLMLVLSVVSLVGVFICKKLMH